MIVQIHLSLSLLLHLIVFLLVIPRSHRLRLLELAHDHATAAHFGRRKTLSRLISRVYWSGIRTDVANYVRACTLCQQYKPLNDKPGGLMKATVVSEPWHTVGIDITGSFTKNASWKSLHLSRR